MTAHALLVLGEEYLLALVDAGAGVLLLTDEVEQLIHVREVRFVAVVSQAGWSGFLDHRDLLHLLVQFPQLLLQMVWYVVLLA